jgi:hypothetical protein
VDVDGQQRQFNDQPEHVRSVRAFLIRKRSVVQVHVAPPPKLQVTAVLTTSRQERGEETHREAYCYLLDDVRADM